MNVAEEVPWCNACQDPHAPYYCAMAQSIVASQDEQVDEQTDGQDQDGMACNMKDSYGRYDFESDSDETDLDVDYQRCAYEDYHQKIFSDNEAEVDNRACNVTSEKNSMNLRKPSTEEINIITGQMVSQVQSGYDLRNKTVNNNGTKAANIFMKDKINKATNADKDLDPFVVQIKDPKEKKWELKKNLNGPSIENK